MTTQTTLKKFLAGRGIPHFSIEVFGMRVKVVTLKEEYATRWAELLAKAADVEPVRMTTAREKKRKGDWYQPPAVPAYEITATIKKGQNHDQTNPA